MRETVLSLCCDMCPLLRSATCLSLRRGISPISMFHAPDIPLRRPVQTNLYIAYCSRRKPVVYYTIVQLRVECTYSIDKTVSTGEQRRKLRRTILTVCAYRCCVASTYLTITNYRDLMYRRLDVSYSMVMLFVATVENHKSVCRPYDMWYREATDYAREREPTP